MTEFYVRSNIILSKRFSLNKFWNKSICWQGLDKIRADKERRREERLAKEKEREERHLKEKEREERERQIGEEMLQDIEIEDHDIDDDYNQNDSGKIKFS